MRRLVTDLQRRRLWAVDRAWMSVACGEQAAHHYGEPFRRHEAVMLWCQGFREGWRYWTTRNVRNAAWSSGHRVDVDAAREQAPIEDDDRHTESLPRSRWLY